MWLLFIALVGLVVPNGYFLYWWLNAQPRFRAE